MVVIAVAGSASRSLPPERGTVRLRVEGEGATATAAIAVVRPVLDRLSAQARELERAGSATRWSAGTAATAVDVRYVGPEDRQERVHTASAPLEVRFRDEQALVRWVGALADESAVRLEGVEWSLTAATRSAVERELRGEAVGDAIARAGDYAAALGIGEVRAVRLQEAVLRPEQRDGWVAQARAVSAGRDGIALHPGPVEVLVRLAADFEPA